MKWILASGLAVALISSTLFVADEDDEPNRKRRYTANRKCMMSPS